MSKHLLIAAKEIGVTGIDGSAHNKRILAYFTEAGFSWVKDDETAWCAAFVNWVLKKSGLKGTGSLAARSFLNYGKRTDAPQIGDLAVFWRISRNSAFGHVAFYIAHDKRFVYVLGGNQSNAVNVKAFPLSQLLEYRTIPQKD